MSKKDTDLLFSPIAIKGHERAIVNVAYNKEGDLLFSSSKDTTPSLWYADTGERVGTYRGHEGAVYGLSVTSDSRFLLTASADTTAKLWDVETGEMLFSWEHKAPLRYCDISEDDSRFLVVAEPWGSPKEPPCIFVYKLNTKEPYNQSLLPLQQIECKTGRGENYARILQAVWCPFNKLVLGCCEDCSVYVYDSETSELKKQISDHSGPVNSITFSPDSVFFATASDDRTAKLYDAVDFKLLKTYETDKPINGVAISPIMDHILLGGGQKAMGVTKTLTESGQFQARFFHLILEEELGTIRGHFGPINVLRFSPDGRSYTSGGEDGYVRIHHLPSGYFSSKLEEEEPNLDNIGDFKRM